MSDDRHQSMPRSQQLGLVLVALGLAVYLLTRTGCAAS